MKILLAILCAGTLAGCAPRRCVTNKMAYQRVTDLEIENLALRTANNYLIEAVQEKQDAVFPDAFDYPGNTAEFTEAEMQGVDCRNEQGATQ